MRHLVSTLMSVLFRTGSSFTSRMTPAAFYKTPGSVMIAVDKELWLFCDRSTRKRGSGGHYSTRFY